MLFDKGEPVVQLWDHFHFRVNLPRAKEGWERETSSF